MRIRLKNSRIFHAVYLLRPVGRLFLYVFYTLSLHLSEICAENIRDRPGSPVQRVLPLRPARQPQRRRVLAWSLLYSQGKQLKAVPLFCRTSQCPLPAPGKSISSGRAGVLMARRPSSAIRTSLTSSSEDRCQPRRSSLLPGTVHAPFAFRGFRKHAALCMQKIPVPQSVFAKNWHAFCLIHTESG